jgi:uncharacterized membrane protein YciS (DUF1049 family)
VFAAYFTNKLSLPITVTVIIGLGVVFTWAICGNIARYSLFWKMHRIARDNWLAGQSAELRNAYAEDPGCRKYLETKTLSPLTFSPVIVVNALPAIAAILLACWEGRLDWTYVSKVVFAIIFICAVVFVAIIWLKPKSRPRPGATGGVH